MTHFIYKYLKAIFVISVKDVTWRFWGRVGKQDPCLLYEDQVPLVRRTPTHSSLLLLSTTDLPVLGMITASCYVSGILLAAV